MNYCQYPVSSLSEPLGIEDCGAPACEKYDGLWLCAPHVEDWNDLRVCGSCGCTPCDCEISEPNRFGGDGVNRVRPPRSCTTAAAAA